MHHALAASAVLPEHITHSAVIDLRMHRHDLAVGELSVWQALQRELEQTLDQHSHELHLHLDAGYMRLQIKTIHGFVESRLPKVSPLNDALELLHSALWPENSQALSSQASFVTALYGRDYVFQADHIQTSSGSTFTIRRLYDAQNPLPQLEELVKLPAQAIKIRQRINQSCGLVLLADIDRTSRVRTARALAQCLTGPDRRVLLSETSCHPLVPGITQIALPLDTQKDEYHQAWLQACDMSHDVIIALEIDHAPARLAKLASENSLVLQGVSAGSASQALAQLIASGTRPEAIARALTSVIVQRQIALACEHCKFLLPLDDKLNNWAARQNTVKPGAIQDWLTERLSDNFVTAPGCEACSDTGVQEVILAVDCVDLSCEVQDAICDGDIRYAMEHLDKTNTFPRQLAKLARQGKITIKHAIDIAESCAPKTLNSTQLK